MSTKTDITTTAARLLGLRFNDAARNSRQLPAEAAIHFWDPARGGGSVIVAADGSYLFANSSVKWDCHLNEFLSGLRSPRRNA
jgi:hypothetical protein